MNNFTTLSDMMKFYIPSFLKNILLRIFASSSTFFQLITSRYRLIFPIQWNHPMPSGIYVKFFSRCSHLRIFEVRSHTTNP